jgi:TonB family protein
VTGQASNRVQALRLHNNARNAAPQADQEGYNMLHKPLRIASRRLPSQSCLRLVIALALPLSPLGTQAQGTVDVAPTERAKRDAEKVFQWIRIHSDKPRKTVNAPPAPVSGAAPVAAKQPARVAAKPADGRASEAAVTLATADSVEERAPGSKASSPVVSEPAAVPQERHVDMPSPAASPVVEEEQARLAPLYRPDPEFPGALMRSLRKGQVQVSFVVQPDGSVSQAKAEAQTHPRLAASAVAAVSQWRFQPLRHAQAAMVELGFDLD